MKAGVGKRFAEMCSALGLNVIIYSKYFQSIKNEFPSYKTTDLNSLLKESDIISFHPEADKNTKKIISIIKKSNCKVGIAVHPNIKIEEIKEFLNDVDLVIIMTVIPGFGGQKFLEDQVQKISELKEIRKNINANYEIEIDGGINYQTSKICIDKGADILVAGSYVYGAPKEEYKDKINSIRHLT